MKIKSLIMVGLLALCSAACSDDTSVVDEPDGPDPGVKPVEPLHDNLRPILTEGKRWVVEGKASYLAGNSWSAEMIPCNVTFTCAVGEDVDLKGYKAKKITVYDNNLGKYWGDEENGGQEVSEEYSRLFGGNRTSPVFREENGMIYRLCQTKSPFGVPDDQIESTYSFIPSCNVIPEHSENYDSFWFISTIVSRGTIVLMGKTRRAVKVWTGCEFFMDFPETDPYDYWVEGIGSLLGQMPEVSYVYPSGLIYLYKARFRLLECYDGDEKIYDYREFNPKLYIEEEVFTDIDKQQ